MVPAEYCIVRCVTLCVLWGILPRAVFTTTVHLLISGTITEPSRCRCGTVFNIEF